MTSGRGKVIGGPERGSTGTVSVTHGGRTEGKDERPKVVTKAFEDLWCNVLVTVVIGTVGKRVVRLIPGVGEVDKCSKIGGGWIGCCVGGCLFIDQTDSIGGIGCCVTGF